MLRLDVDIKVWRDGKRHCLVKFSVPEMLYGSNTYPAEVKDLPTALDALMNDLSRVGTEPDFSRAQIVRLDLARQERMVDPFDTYARILRRIHVPSTDLRGRNSTVLWLHRHGNWAINAYDKSTQLGQRSGSQNGVLRLELQRRTRRTVERALGYSTVTELLESTDQLGEVYRSFLNKRLRVQSLLEASVTDENTTSRIEHLARLHSEKGGERWRSELLERLGLAFMCRELGVENTLSLLGPIGAGASSTERSRHSRLVSKACAAVLDLDQQKPLTEPRDSEHARILESIQGIIAGRII